jgi:hypothetical protein
MVGPVCQPDIMQQGFGGFCRFGLCGASNQQGHHDVLESREFREKVMELEYESDNLISEAGQLGRTQGCNLPVQNFNGTPVRPVHSADQVKQSAFARTGNSGYPDHLPFPDDEGQPNQNCQPLIPGIIPLVEISHL